ncbi:MAG: cytochrome ubiquinol oxidase subunit I [Thermoplasmata archaeon]|jgi:cytochrome d ubiquinol oxidase subunit I
MSIPIVDFDRFLFAFTIGSHILIVSLSIGLAIMLCAVEFLSARSKDRYYGALARRLVRPFVVSFGIGTASGIVMAVELVNLFPGFMTLVSKTGVISIFYVEIFAFFLETVFLVVYVYYGKLFHGRYTRWLLTLPIVIGTLLSAVLIVMVNAWMNTPNGFDIGTYLATGAVTGVDPWAPFLTPSTGYEVFHVLATVPLTGIMMIGGFFAYRYHKSSNPDERTLFVKGLRITVALSLVLVVLTVISGVLQIENLYRYQPLKYAAMELNVNPGTNLPETVFGWLNGTTVVGAIQIPGLQGILSDHANVPGLSQYPSSDWPPLIIHDTFDTMVLLGVLLGLFLFGYAGLWVLKRRPFDRRFLAWGFVVFTVVTTVVMELGWMTDELGRQPWIVYNVMTVSQAASTNSDLFYPGLVIIAAYIFLVPFTFWFMARVFRSKSIEADLAGPTEGTDVNY